MTRRDRTPRACALGAALTLALTSCALFRPERVEVASQVTETLPPEAIVPVPSQSAVPGAPGTGSRTLFIPGRAGRAGSRGCLDVHGVPGISNGVIRLGTIQPMDGPAAQLGKPLYRATQAYVSGLNARGGINGCRVELSLQTACINCEAENLLAAKALVEQRKVFAVVNTYMNTYAFSSALKYLNRRGVPLVQGWSGTGDESITWDADQTDWNVYYTVRNESAVQIYADWLERVLDAWADAGKLQNAEHPYWVATVALDVSQDRKRSRAFKEVWERRPGHKVVSQQYVAAQEESLTRMDSFITAMRDADANGVFSATNATFVFGMQAADHQSWKVPWVSKSAWGRTATDLCGSACDGGFTDNNGWGWKEILTPQMQQYRQTMQRYFPEGWTFADAQTLGGWIGMMGFEYAATQLGAGLNRAGLMQVLGNLRNFETGIGATINTSQADHLGMGQMMMLQICHNRFWRVTGWLSAGRSMKRVANDGDCGWGY